MSRRTLLPIFIVTILFSLTLGAASPAAAPVFTPEFFRSQAQNALAESDDTKMIRVFTDLYSRQKTLGYPNCFECSLWLMRETAAASPTKQLIVAEYAVLFSPDLPVVHLHRFSTVLRHRAGDIGLLFSSLGRYFMTSLRTVDREPFLAGAALLLQWFAGLLFLVMALVMLAKYARPLAHLFSHVGGFSLFHSIMGLTVLLAGIVLHVKGIMGLEFYFLILLFFCYRLMRYREFTLLTILFALYLSAGIALDVVAYHISVSDPEGIDRYHAVYNPLLQGKDTFSGEKESVFFANAMGAFYRRQFKTADRLFSEYAAVIRDRHLEAIVHNLRGVCAGEQGQFETARKHFTEAGKIDDRPAYLFNLSRALYSEGNIKDAEQVEMNALSRSGRMKFDYPMIVLPTPYDYYRITARPERLAPLTADPLVRRFAGLLLLLLIVALVWRLGAARISIVRCAECGEIICEECGGSDEEICLACRVVKAGRKLIGSHELTAHTHRREAWSDHHRRMTIFFAALFPGAGLLFDDRILEGFFLAWAALTVGGVFFLSRFFGYLPLETTVPGILPILGGLLLGFLWIVGFYRAWRVAHNE